MVMTFALIAPAAAQSKGALLGAGLTILNDSESTGVGFMVDLAKNIKPLGKSAFGIVADFGLSGQDGYNITTVGGGVRFTHTVNTKVMPFGQFLVGGEFCCDESAFQYSVGGGVDIGLISNLNLRLQYDYRRAEYEGVGFNNNRFTFGISTRLGGN
jgi:opacity protein-like surface antigen